MPICSLSSSHKQRTRPPSWEPFDERTDRRFTHVCRGLMTIYLLALLLGVIAGLRAMTAPAAASWAAYLGWLDVGGTWLAFLSHALTRWVLTLVALGELVTDQLSSTPSRTVPLQFAGRIATGALSGAAIGTADGAIVGGLLAGIVGAVIGTLGGRAFRARLAAAFGSDRPAAFIEDAIALVGALLIVIALR